MSKKPEKKIDMLLWLKGVNAADEGEVLKTATKFKEYTDDIVVVAGAPEQLLEPQARRELLGGTEGNGDE